MNGILIIDKPSGVTSHDVVYKIRKITGCKVGHGGTLDPLATGVLPILVGDATKSAQEVLLGDKEYLTMIKFGETTDTDDKDGKVLELKPVPDDLEARLKGALPQFRGIISQIPPRYSAIKHKGQPLYKLARKGVDFEPQARQVEIKGLEVRDVSPPFATLYVKCSKGLYIRALARDIGKAIACAAHVYSLKRVVCGSFHIGDAHCLEKINSLQDVTRMLHAPVL